MLYTQEDDAGRAGREGGGPSPQNPRAPLTEQLLTAMNKRLTLPADRPPRQVPAHPRGRPGGRAGGFCGVRVATQRRGFGRRPCVHFRVEQVRPAGARRPPVSQSAVRLSYADICHSRGWKASRRSATAGRCSPWFRLTRIALRKSTRTGLFESPGAVPVTRSQAEAEYHYGVAAVVPTESGHTSESGGERRAAQQHMGNGCAAAGTSAAAEASEMTLTARP